MRIRNPSHPYQMYAQNNWQPVTMRINEVFRRKRVPMFLRLERWWVKILTDDMHMQLTEIKIFNHAVLNNSKTFYKTVILQRFSQMWTTNFMYNLVVTMSTVIVMTRQEIYIWKYDMLVSAVFYVRYHVIVTSVFKTTAFTLIIIKIAPTYLSLNITLQFYLYTGN